MLNVLDSSIALYWSNILYGCWGCGACKGPWLEHGSTTPTSGAVRAFGSTFLYWGLATLNLQQSIIGCLAGGGGGVVSKHGGPGP